MILTKSPSVSLLCVLFFFTLSWKKPPNMVMQIVLMISAFVMSIVWLYMIANEVVSVLQALGLLTKISTGWSSGRTCTHTHNTNTLSSSMYTNIHTPHSYPRVDCVGSRELCGRLGGRYCCGKERQTRDGVCFLFWCTFNHSCNGTELCYYCKYQLY